MAMPVLPEQLERQASPRSLRGLDGLNFLMADVRDGLGPYLSIFLKGPQHWAASQIGVALAVGSIAAVICQVPAGLLVDRIRVKRTLVAVAGLMIAACCLLIAFFPAYPTVIAAQIVLGGASAVIPLHWRRCRSASSAMPASGPDQSQ